MSVENIYRFPESFERVHVYFEEVKLQTATEVMPAMDALIADMSSEDGVIEGVIVGAVLGTGVGIYIRSMIGDRELMPSKLDDVGSIGVLAILGGMVGGLVDYVSKGF